jgi:hypothetical protein
MKVFLFLFPKSEMSPCISADGEPVSCDAAPSSWFEESMIVRPDEPSVPEDADSSFTVPLITLAWARSGDKGNLFNVGVFAREPRFHPYIAASLTADAVGEWYAHLLDDPAHPKIDRYLLPGSSGLNFVVNDSLGGGGTQCARIDPIAKTMGQILLEFPVSVSRQIAEEMNRGTAGIDAQ